MRLPKAEVARVKLSSGMLKTEAIQMGLIQWIMEAGKDEDPALRLWLSMAGTGC